MTNTRIDKSKIYVLKDNDAEEVDILWVNNTHVKFEYYAEIPNRFTANVERERVEQTMTKSDFLELYEVQDEQNHDR